MYFRCRPNFLALTGLILLIGKIGHADGPGTTGGLVLLEAPGARLAALGEAGTAARHDVTAAWYNPAALNSLPSMEASLLYQKGILDDAYGHIGLGGPIKNAAVGVAVGYYDGGNADVFDNGQYRTVRAQTDLVTNLGYARRFGIWETGAAVKYLRSELAETASAATITGDLGVAVPIRSGWHAAAAVQNIAGKMTYVSVGTPLPRIFRAGVSWSTRWRSTPLLFLADAPYIQSEKFFSPRLGVEAKTGPLSLRLGYKSGYDVEGVSFGAGMQLGEFSVDYSMGLVDDFDSRHRVSVSLRLGGPRSVQSVAAPATPKNGTTARAITRSTP